MSLTQRTTTQKNSHITTAIIKDKPKVVAKPNTAVPAKNITGKSILQQSKQSNAAVLPKSTASYKPNDVLKKPYGIQAAAIRKTTTTVVSKEVAKPKPSTVTSQALLKESVSHSSTLINTIINVDEGDENDPCLVSEYIQDIYSYLKTLEVKFKIEENYLVGHQTSARNRSILINWLVGICTNFKFLAETFHLTVGILDRYLQVHKTVGSGTLQLVGVTAMVIAAKYEEIYLPTMKDFIFITDDSITVADIFETEIDILKKIEFNLGKPLSIHFLRRFAKVASPDVHSYNLAKYFLEIFLLDYNLCHIAPSLQAAAALCLSMYIFNEKAHIRVCWTKTLEYYSGYNYEALNVPILKLVLAYYKMEKSRFQAVKKKYSDSKLGNISNHSKLVTSKVLKNLHETALTKL